MQTGNNLRAFRPFQNGAQLEYFLQILFFGQYPFGGRKSRPLCGGAADDFQRESGSQHTVQHAGRLSDSHDMYGCSCGNARDQLVVFLIDIDINGNNTFAC